VWLRITQTFGPAPPPDANRPLFQAYSRPLAVFVELDDLFELHVPVEARPSATVLFPFQERADLERGAQDSCEVLARVECWWPQAAEPQLEALREQALLSDASRRTRRDGEPPAPLEQALAKTDVVERAAPK